MGQVALEQGERGHDEADEEAAAVAEEDPAGPEAEEVEEQEPEQAAHEGHEHEADEELAEGDRVEQQDEGGDEGNSRAARPSMLSRRLKAFVIPTIQSTVTTMFIHSKGRKEMRTSADDQEDAAARSWPEALAAT